MSRFLSEKELVDMFYNVKDSFFKKKNDVDFLSIQRQLFETQLESAVDMMHSLRANISLNSKKIMYKYRVWLSLARQMRELSGTRNVQVIHKNILDKKVGELQKRYNELHSLKDVDIILGIKDDLSARRPIKVNFPDPAGVGVER